MHKAVFLDRDDTLISDPGGTITQPTHVRLLPGAGQALAQLKKMGYLLVVATNQPAVARGQITEAALEEVHHHLKKLLADEGVYLDALYYCPYHPEGTVEQFTHESELRKPSPGMLLKAAKELDIDLAQSWMIGDSYRDVAAGHRAGCQTILLDTPGKAQVRGHSDPEPDRRAVNLREAVNILRMVEFQQKVQSARAARAQEEASSTPPQTPATETAEPAVAEEPAAPIRPVVSEPAEAETTPAVPVAAAPEKTADLKPAELAVPPSVPVEPECKAREPVQPSADANTQQLLEEILHHVKSKNRYDQYAEFSVFMLLAWLVQALAAFSLVLSVWFWLDSGHGVEAVQTMIGYAAALELLVIALLIMHEKNKS